MIEWISDIINSPKVDISLHRAISELVISKIKTPRFSIRAAKKRGILNFSNSYHYNVINTLGGLFINGYISLEDFFFDMNANTNISDATYVKRERKEVYEVFKNLRFLSTKKIKNYVNRSYELLQDLLLTTRRYKGLSFIENLKIINHNKRHKTKPEEIVELIKKRIKRGVGSYSQEMEV